jgi:hypothetical protein
MRNEWMLAKKRCELQATGVSLGRNERITRVKWTANGREEGRKRQRKERGRTKKKRG